jgi:hypothetical protein
MERRRTERTGFSAARVILSLAPVLWGFVLLGVAMWLLSQRETAAALPCLAFSAGYFWFAWSLYKDPTWASERTSHDARNAPVFEPRAKPEPSGFDRNSRALQKSPGRHDRPRSSRDRVA